MYPFFMCVHVHLLQLFRRPHRQRKVFSSTPTASADSSAATSITIVDSMRVFYKNLIQLMPSKDPIKGDIQLKITTLKLYLSLMDSFSPPSSSSPLSLSLSLPLPPSPSLSLSRDTRWGESNGVCHWQDTYSCGEEQTPASSPLQSLFHVGISRLQCPHCNGGGRQSKLT